MDFTLLVAVCLVGLDLAGRGLDGFDVAKLKEASVVLPSLGSELDAVAVAWHRFDEDVIVLHSVFNRERVGAAVVYLVIVG